MISPIKANSLNFKGVEQQEPAQRLFKAVQEYSKPPVVQGENKPELNAEKKNISDTFEKTKTKVVDTFKTINTATGVSKGAIAGVAKGATVTGVIALLGKNIFSGEGLKTNSFGKVITGVVKDLGKVSKKLLNVIPSLITKSPLENTKNLLNTVPNFYKNYLKGHKMIALIATLAGACTVALNTYLGKINANRKNADIDHSVNTGHNQIK